MQSSVLAITSELPWPLDSGGRLRTFHVMSALAAACDLRLVVPVRPEHAEHVETLKAKGINVVAVPVPPRTKLGEARRLVQSRCRGEPYVMYGRHVSAEVFAAWERELQARPDVVWLDHIDSLLFVSQARATGARTIIDLHNIYSLILDRMAAEAANPAKRWFFRGEAKRLAKMEASAATLCDTVLAVSTSEAEHFRKLGAKNVTVAPNGVDCSAFASLPTGRTVNPQTVLFLGTMSWGPNVSAAVTLAKQIFPEVRKQISTAELLLVGRDPSPVVQALAGNRITVTGAVPSILPYLERATLLAVPLDAGGGTRLKILEAFAAGLPVVSTAVGAEGIDAVAGEHLVIAERPEIANAIANLLNDESERRRLAENARQLVQSNYDWKEIGTVCVKAVSREL